MPKTIEKANTTKESVIMERSVEKIIVQRSTTRGQDESNCRRLSELYQELKTAAAETGTVAQPNSKVVNPNNDVDRLYIIRKGFRKITAEKRQNILDDLVMERQRKLEKIQKLENITNLSREVINNIASMRKHTENVMLRTLKQCRLLCEQLQQPDKEMEDLNVKEESIHSMMQQETNP